MGSYQRGTTITLNAYFRNETSGEYIDPDAGTITCKVYKDGTEIWDGTSLVTKYDVGKYFVDWDTSDSLAAGLYVYEFTAEIDGKDVVESGMLRIRTRIGG